MGLLNVRHDKHKVSNIITEIVTDQIARDKVVKSINLFCYIGLDPCYNRTNVLSEIAINIESVTNTSCDIIPINI